MYKLLYFPFLTDLKNKTMRDANPQTIYLKDYSVPDYLIESVELTVILDEEKTCIVSKLTVKNNPLSDNKNSPLILQGEGLELVSIAIDGAALSDESFTKNDENLCIETVPQDQDFILAIENIVNPKNNTALEGLYLSSTMLCTQCEAEGFRKITYFLDRPDIMCRFKTTLIGDKEHYPVLLSNGNKVAEGELKNNRHWVTWEDPFKKPCYLFALVAGQLDCIEDTFTTMSGREIALQIFVEAHDVDKCDHAMQSLKNSMRWDEQTYGREYDLDLYMIVAVGHFNMGAMENKGLNIFNTKFVLARPDTATDSDYEYIEGVIGHEYFHNWTGNRITCRDWFQLSLKEGFTVFRDQEFTGDQTSKAVKRIEDVKLLRNRQFAEDAGPLSHPIRPEAYIEINNFYTLTVYEKGAEVVRMIQTLVGEEGFRKGSDLYFKRHDGQAVTCEDFVCAMEVANDFDLALFRRWYSQAGTPEISVKEDYDPQQKTLTLQISQSTPPTQAQETKQALHIPIKLGLLTPSGDIEKCYLTGQEGGEEVILQLKEKQQTFVFEQLEEKPTVSLLRQFSAPVIVKMDQSLEELAFLLSHDSDSFNRWEAGQKMSGKIIFGLIKDCQQGKTMLPNPLLIEAYKKILQQPFDDLSYLSLLLSLPDESYLAGQMDVIDVDAIHQAREFTKHSLAQQLQSLFKDLYQKYHQDESGKFDSGAIGRRRIKNCCLDYLTQLESDASYQLADQQFKSSNNMTDQMSALVAIVNSQNPAKQTSLQNFYQQWQDEALVIDKWFALQASSSATDTFSTVQDLMDHPAFELTNPNRVRSLIGVFSQTNQLHFHAENGQGYQFLAQQVIALNGINPQVASRMVSGLTQWRRFDKNRQQLMKSALEKVIKTANISIDVYEVANKSLV